MYLDGQLRRKMHSFHLHPFSGEEAICNLPIIPARFFTGADKNMLPSEVTAEQIRLGKVAWDLYKGPSYKSYEGERAKKSPYPGRISTTCPTGYMTGRVIIDGEGFERYTGPIPGPRRPLGPPLPYGAQLDPVDQLPHFAARCGCGACKKSEGADEMSTFAAFHDLDPKHDRAPESDLYYHVISKVISGFILGERRWGHFHVANLCDIKFDREAFKYLVLDEEIKLTVKALIGKLASVDGHVSAWPNDFVKNKGQGRIFLLHGSPGVGK
jgi:hypothetical protein